jgi:hypothetical protein
MVRSQYFASAADDRLSPAQLMIEELSSGAARVTVYDGARAKSVWECPSATSRFAASLRTTVVRQRFLASAADVAFSLRW